MPLLEAADLPEELEEEDQSPRLFPEEQKRTLETLAQLGAKSEKAYFAGHEFIFRTLTVDERLVVGLLTKDYQDTMGANLAWVTAWAALAIQKVDGELLPFPFEESGVGHAWAIQRFDYVKARWYKFTIDFVYSKCMELEGEVEAALAEMAKISG